MKTLLAGLRAAAEPTRLRLLAICAQDEMTVGELTEILGQSQPRVSRHLKLLCDAGLVDRFKEGTWVFYRIAEDRHRSGGTLARQVCALLAEDDSQLALDRERFRSVKQRRAETAAAYFRANAGQWDRIRSLHVEESEVEQALVEAMAVIRVRELLDVGTGTGRILALFGAAIERGLGVDLAHAMLQVARANLEAEGLTHCRVRHGDMYRLPLEDGSFDAVTVHQVLHYADKPALAIGEAARVLRPGGILAVVDFAPHELEYLRVDHAHRRLGFADHEVDGWCDAAGLEPHGIRRLPGGPLTVVLWTATKPAPDGAAGGRTERIEAEAQPA